MDVRNRSTRSVRAGHLRDLQLALVARAERRGAAASAPALRDRRSWLDSDGLEQSEPTLGVQHSRRLWGRAGRSVVPGPPPRLLEQGLDREVEHPRDVRKRAETWLLLMTSLESTDCFDRQPRQACEVDLGKACADSFPRKWRAEVGTEDSAAARGEHIWSIGKAAQGVSGT